MNDKIIDSIRSSEVAPRDEKEKRCAPNVKFDAGSCIELHLLIAMANAYNIEHAAKPIKMFAPLETLNPRKYKKYLLREINKKVSQCSTQKCWTEQSFIDKMNSELKTELTKLTFRPDGPNGRFEWLNTININETLNQYELANPDFEFLGAVPMDFDELPSLEISTIDWNKKKNEGKTKIGIVFNLDEHWKSGSHWVALYADLKKAECYYFDSYGVAPEPRVRKLMRRICKAVSIDEKCIADHNKIRHQYENSECGVYSINFILRMLHGESFRDICESKIHDREVNKCRNVYFGNVDIKANDSRGNKTDCY